MNKRTLTNVEWRYIKEITENHILYQIIRIIKNFDKGILNMVDILTLLNFAIELFFLGIPFHNAL